MPTLHGTELSPFVRKVRIALAEKGLGYDHNPVIHLALPDGFDALHPLKKIPVWTTDEGENIADSSVILSYIDRIHPEPRVIPEDPIQMARALFLEEFSDDALAPTIAVIFLEQFAAPLILGKEPDQARIDKALAKLPDYFGYLDQTVGHRDFMVGDTLTVADCAITSSLVNFRHTGHAIDGDAFPNLRRYADAILRRPTIAKIFADEIAQYGGSSPEAAARASA